jgi:hypothetical protein
MAARISPSFTTSHSRIGRKNTERETVSKITNFEKIIWAELSFRKNWAVRADLEKDFVKLSWAMEELKLSAQLAQLFQKGTQLS